MSQEQMSKRESDQERYFSVEEVEDLMTRLTNADEVTQADILWLPKFYQASQTAHLPQPPAIVGQFLEQQFAVYAQTRLLKPHYKSLLAHLDFDSYKDSTRPDGLSSATFFNQRCLVYTTQLATIYITLKEHSQNGRFSIIGRVLPLAENPGPFQVLLLKDGQEFDNMLTNDLGKFTLKMLPPGEYDLIYSNPQYEISISALHLPYENPESTGFGEGTGH